MKRRHACLSFDEESLSSGSEAPHRRLKGLPQVPQSPAAKQDESIAQLAALRVALGLTRARGEREHEKEESDKQEGTEDQEPEPPAELPSLRDIASFSEFLRLSPLILLRAPELPVHELAALCETAARLKFFDKELFEPIFDILIAKIGQLSVEQITAVAVSIIDLNAYSPPVFSAAASALAPVVGKLSNPQRLQWLKLLAAAGHCDEEFEVALRTTPLPGGQDVNAHDDFMICWDLVRNGHCPRGATCRWAHPAKERKQ